MSAICIGSYCLYEQASVLGKLVDFFMGTMKSRAVFVCVLSFQTASSANFA